MFSLSIHSLMNFEIQPVEQNVFSNAISVYKNQIIVCVKVFESIPFYWMSIKITKETILHNRHIQVAYFLS